MVLGCGVVPRVWEIFGGKFFRKIPGIMMPIYIISLIGVLKALGWQQQDIAARLQVVGPSVSLWATGARPLPRRYEAEFLSLVADELARPMVEAQVIGDYLADWSAEMAAVREARQEVVRRILTRFGSEYITYVDEPMSSLQWHRVARDCRQLGQVIRQIAEDDGVVEHFLEKVQVARGRAQG